MKKTAQVQKFKLGIIKILKIMTSVVISVVIFFLLPFLVFHGLFSLVFSLIFSVLTFCIFTSLFFFPELWLFALGRCTKILWITNDWERIYRDIIPDNKEPLQVYLTEKNIVSCFFSTSWIMGKRILIIDETFNSQLSYHDKVRILKYYHAHWSNWWIVKKLIRQLFESTYSMIIQFVLVEKPQKEDKRTLVKKVFDMSIEVDRLLKN